MTAVTDRDAGTVLCPSCQDDLPPGAAACPACRLPLTGPVAARLWVVDQQLAALRGERAALLATLRGVTVPPASAGRASLTDGASTAVPPRTGWTGSQVLLACGALLLVAAAVVFLAVAWSAIGVAGQVVVMAALTATAGTGAVVAARRMLGSTAEALAAVCVGLLVLDLAAARTLGLGTLADVDGNAYAAGSGVLAAAVLAALYLAGARLRAFAVGAHLGASTVVGALAAQAGSSTGSAVGFAAAASAGAGLFAAGARWAPPRTGWLRTAAAGPALSWAVVATLAAAGVVFDDPAAPAPVGAEELAAVLVLAVVAAAAVLVVWRARRDGGLSRSAVLAAPLAGPHRSLVGAGLLAVGAGTLTLSAPGFLLGALASGVSAVTAAVVAVAVAWGRLHRTGRGLLVWAWTAGVVALSLVSSMVWESQLTGAVVLAAAAAVGAPAWRWPSARAGVAAVQAALLGGGLWAAADLGGDPVVAVVLTVFAVACLAVVVAPVSPGVAGAVTAVGAAWFVAAAAMGFDAGGADGAAAVLAVASLCAAGRAVRARAAAVPAALAATVALWLVLGSRDVDLVEAYSAPAALFAAVACGWLGWRRACSSWVLVGVPLTVALVPSAVAGVGGEVGRPLVTAAVAAVVLWWGARQGWQAPLVLGAGTLVFTVAVLVLPYTHVVPRWLVLGAVGAGLLVAGARYEAGVAGARRASRALAQMR